MADTINRHKRTGDLYRILHNAFDVSTQRRCVVYMSLHTGQIFVRDAEKFASDFDFVKNCGPGTVMPKAPKVEEQLEMFPELKDARA